MTSKQTAKSSNYNEPRSEPDQQIVSKPRGKYGYLQGPSFFLEISTDIRLLIYDLVLKQHKRKSGVKKLRRSTDAIRFVNRQIAEETFPYLFEVLDVGRLLTGDGDHMDRFDEFRGRHRRFMGVHPAPRITLGECCQYAELRLALENTVRTPDTGADPVARVDAPTLHAAWDEIGWPLEKRNVQTMTVSGAERLESFGAFNDMLVYLALVTEYFPTLKELRLVYRRLRGDEYEYDTNWYRIVGREVQDWDTAECKWLMPTVSFHQGQIEDSVRTRTRTVLSRATSYHGSGSSEDSD